MNEWDVGNVRKVVSGVCIGWTFDVWTCTFVLEFVRAHGVTNV